MILSGIFINPLLERKAMSEDDLSLDHRLLAREIMNIAMRLTDIIKNWIIV